MNLRKVQDTQNNNIQNNSTQHNDIQHENKKMWHLASISMTFNSYAECRYAEFHGAKNIEWKLSNIFEFLQISQNFNKKWNGQFLLEKSSEGSMSHFKSF